MEIMWKDEIRKSNKGDLPLLDELEKKLRMQECILLN